MDCETQTWVSIGISFVLEKGELVVWESLISLVSWDSKGVLIPLLSFPWGWRALSPSWWSHGAATAKASWFCSAGIRNPRSREAVHSWDATLAPWRAAVPKLSPRNGKGSCCHSGSSKSQSLAPPWFILGSQTWGRRRRSSSCALEQGKAAPSKEQAAALPGLASLQPAPEVQESAGSSKASGEIQEGNREGRKKREDKIEFNFLLNSCESSIQTRSQEAFLHGEGGTGSWKGDWRTFGQFPE